MGKKAGSSKRNDARTPLSVAERMEGMVIRNTGSSYMVLVSPDAPDTPAEDITTTVPSPEGTVVECHIKGKFRLKGIRTTNPVAVGDRVTIMRNPDGTAYITAIAPRRNYICLLYTSDAADE